MNVLTLNLYCIFLLSLEQRKEFSFPRYTGMKPYPEKESSILRMKVWDGQGDCQLRDRDVTSAQARDGGGGCGGGRPDVLQVSSMLHGLKLSIF